MASTVLYMSMPLDGFIAGPNDELGNPGDDGRVVDRPHEWGAAADGSRPPGPAGELFDQMQTTSAMQAGRRTVEQVDQWGSDHHGVPILVPCHRPPDP